MSALLENRLLVILVALAFMLGSASLTGAALDHQHQGPGRAAGANGAGHPGAQSACSLANGIQHVIYLQFDSVRLSRDVAAVPSDLEQMPHLLDFLQANGSLLTANHTALASDTGGDALTSLTGLYPDHHGQTISDSWRYFKPDGTTGWASSLTYWSSRVGDGRGYNLVTTGGRNVPAPWAAFARAGCDVGAVGGPGNMVLQNTTSDLEAVFGADSREASEARAPGSRAAADFLGLAIHCAAHSVACGRQNGGRPDRLPDEPGGYEDFNALYGQRNVAPWIGGSGTLSDLAGRPIDGFPGFDAMTPTVSLAFVAAMQEHGVPITYAYLADAHDAKAGGRALGPGEPSYVRQLHDYDQAFATFLQRLARDGLTAANTVFVVSAAEGGHFVGATASPAGCDGLRTPCRYAQTGQVQVNLAGLLAAQNLATPFTMHEDSAPAIWINGDPGPTAPQTRSLQKAASQLQVQDPYLRTGRPLVRYVADRPEMRLLHMITADQTRTPSFVLFAQPNYLLGAGPAGCGADGCVRVDPHDAYNHGGMDPESTTTWLALAGPGVARGRIDRSTWADEADIRPTLLALVGLQDRYAHDGRVLSEVLLAQALPAGIAASQAAYEGVAGRLKQLNAPVGRVAMLSLPAGTRAAVSNSAGDAEYRSYVARIQGFTRRREAAVERMIGALEEAAFAGRPLDAKTASALMEAADGMTAEMGRA